MAKITNNFIISFELNKDRNIEKNEILSGNYKVVYDIDGNLIVYLNNEMFFSEPYISLIDFAISLNKWIKIVKTGRIENFKYQPLDNDQPILYFNQLANSNWNIHSPRQIFASNSEFKLEELINSIESFLKELQIELLKSYGIGVINYIYRKYF